MKRNVVLFLAVTIAVCGGIALGLVIRSVWSSWRYAEMETERDFMRSQILASVESIRIGATLADGEFTYLNGTPARLFDLLRRKTIIMVVDLECGSCIEQIQLIMNRGRREFGEADFLFISASPRDALVKLSGSFDSGPTFLYDKDGQWQRRFNIQIYPLTLAVDKSGTIVGMEVTSLSLEQIRNLITSDDQKSHSGPTDALQPN